MNVLMSSTSYPRDAEDWRGRFIVNLAASLGRRPDIQLDLWAPPGELPPGVHDIATPEERQWLQTLSERGGIAHLLRHDRLLAAKASIGLLQRLHHAYRRHQPQVMHVNWLQNALPLSGTRTPAVVSVLGTDFGLLRLPGMRLALRRVFKQRPTVLAPNAQWMAPRLQAMFGDVAQVRPIPFGIDQSWFDLQRAPPEDRPRHWLAVTRLTKNKIGDLFDWGAGLFGPDRILHLFGPMQETVAVPDWVQYHGPTHPAALLTTWFPQAAGLITLSRHDEGRPQVMLEAMAAGLPIIASDLPAHASFIDHHRTGWISSSPDDLAAALTRLEDPAENLRIGSAARQWAADSVGTWDDCAARYAAVYAQLLAGPPVGKQVAHPAGVR